MNPTVLVAKMVPPGAEKLPAAIQLAPGDSLTMEVVTYGEAVEARWESEFTAHIYMRIEFDYMEVRSVGSEHGKLFTEVHHAEEGQDR